jgi:flagellar basal-body rod protein FlgG
MRALRTAASGMSAQQLNVEVISNNLANLNTVGYKRQRAQFQDLLYQNQLRAGALSSDTGTIVPTGIQIGTGVKTGSVYRITEQGTPARTGNKLDVAIDGRGFFQILLPSGETAYTRDGTFSKNDQGQIVTSDGYLVQPTITIPPDATDITISADGQVQVAQPGIIAPVQIGQITLATFINEAGLEAIGGNLFLESGASGAATIGTANIDGVGKLLHQFTEASNVDAVTEITSLIVAQRAYEMNSKVISSTDQMLSTANQMKS